MTKPLDLAQPGLASATAARAEALIGASGMLAHLSIADRGALAERASRRRLHRGDIVVRRGDPSDALFIVVSGRFHVLQAGGRIVAEIGAGEPIGEIGFFAGEPRTADVVAARDSEVLVLTRADYDALAARAPQLPHAIIEALAKRLARAAATAPSMKTRVADTIAVCPVGPVPMPPGLIEGLAAAMAGPARVAVIGPDDLPQGVDPADERKVAEWLMGLERGRRRQLLKISGDGGAWDRAVLRQSDGVVFVGRLAAATGAPVPLNPAERYADGLHLEQNRTLILWRERAATEILGTDRWLKGRQINLHHHLALDSGRDFARIGRFLTGKALGLVLEGGGALGCAHVGIARAFRDAGIEIDIYGGSSVGAAMGIALAAGLTPEHIMEMTDEIFQASGAFRRYTVPFYSLVCPKRFDRELQDKYEGRLIENLPFNAFATATNLTTRNLEILRSGPSWAAVRASGALPAVLPPYVNQDGDILVDGCLLDTLPIATMRRLKPGPNIAVEFAWNGNWRTASRYDRLPGRVRLAFELMVGRRRNCRFPKLHEVLSRSLLVHSRRRLESALCQEDIQLTAPTLPRMSIMDWHLGRKLEQVAYRTACEQIETRRDLSALLRHGCEEPLAA